MKILGQFQYQPAAIIGSHERNPPELAIDWEGNGRGDGLHHGHGTGDGYGFGFPGSGEGTPDYQGGGNAVTDGYGDGSEGLLFPHTGYGDRQGGGGDDD